jgi:hypothetical protein
MHGGLVIAPGKPSFIGAPAGEAGRAFTPKVWHYTTNSSFENKIKD